MRYTRMEMTAAADNIKAKLEDAKLTASEANQLTETEAHALSDLLFEMLLRSRKVEALANRVKARRARLEESE
jgi:hypothetical protein